MVLMDKNKKKVTHVRDVRHHANCLEKKFVDNTNLRIFWIRTVVSTDTTKKFVRRAHSVTHSYGKCKPIAGFSFFCLPTYLTYIGA